MRYWGWPSLHPSAPSVYYPVFAPVGIHGRHAGDRQSLVSFRGAVMNWTKPAFEEVAVTLEVTAYAARR